MTRETKFSLIVGFTLILVVGVLLSDHFSGANRSALADVTGLPEDAESILPPQAMDLSESIPAPPPRARQDRTADTPREPAPLVIHQGSSQPLNPFGAHDAPVEVPSLSQTNLKLTDPLADNPNFTPVDPANDPFQPRFTRTPPQQTPTNPVEPRALQPVEPSAMNGPASNPPAANSGQAQPETPASWHVVKKDESLMTISRFYYGSVRHWRKILEANPGRVDADGGIRIGAPLLIPSRESILGPSTTPAAPTTDAAPPRATPTDTPRTYTVKAGDTLSKIAQRELGSKSRINDIIALNGDRLSDPDDIRVGMVLRLPGSAPAADPQPIPSPSGTKRTYTVQPGDTLGKIAARELGSSRRVEDIMELNPTIKEENEIFAGMVISLPAR